VKPAIERLNMGNYFDAVVTAEDNGSPEVSCAAAAAYSEVGLCSCSHHMLFGVATCLDTTLGRVDGSSCAHCISC
jgi:hypothetical protein